MQSQWSKSTANAAAQHIYKPIRRTRVPLSCDLCRSRKLRCNREQPCQNCTARAEHVTCRYRGTPKELGSGVADYVDPMQQRIDRLEGLVKTLMTQNQEMITSRNVTLPKDVMFTRDGFKPDNGSNGTTESKGVSTMHHSAGTTVITGGHSVYRTANDWSDVLQEVNELRKAWNQTQVDSADHDMHSNLSNMVAGSSLLSGQVKQVEMSELLADLPSKPELDKLIYQFFDRDNFAIPTVPVLHEPTFMREYADHWRDPSLTTPIWLGLVFSILSVVMYSYSESATAPDPYITTAATLLPLYRLRTAQCIILGDIAKCCPYTLETLLLNSTAELARADDNSRGLWQMTAIMVRAAVNMGYHREPSLNSASSISILQAEFRRRVWLAIVTKDDLASFLVGFPTMMAELYSDTQEPRNIYDWELDVDTIVLPKSRSLEEATPVTYLIVKSRLMRALGRATNFNSVLRQESSVNPYNRVLEIDCALHTAFEDIPTHMKLAGRNSSSGSSSSSSSSSSGVSQSQSATAISMFQMEYMYHRGMIALHRAFLSRSRRDQTGTYALSSERCVSSALAMLTQQSIFHNSFPAEGKPRSMPLWYTIAQVRQSVVLAGMILCLELEHRRRDASLTRRTDTNRATAKEITSFHDEGTLLRALERSCAIWEEVQGTSDEANRAYQVLNSMLLSFGSTAVYPIQVQMPEGAVITPETELNEPLQNVSTSELINGFSSSAHSLEEDVWDAADGMDIDWATWDSFIEGTTFDDAWTGTQIVTNS